MMLLSPDTNSVSSCPQPVDDMEKLERLLKERGAEEVRRVTA